MPHAGCAFVAAVLVAAATAGCTGPPPAPASPAVEVSRGKCGVGWHSPHGGDQSIAVYEVHLKRKDAEQQIAVRRRISIHSHLLEKAAAVVAIGASLLLRLCRPGAQPL